MTKQIKKPDWEIIFRDMFIDEDGSIHPSLNLDGLNVVGEEIISFIFFQINQAEQRGYNSAIDQAIKESEKMDLRCEECVGTGQNNKAAWDYGKDIDCQYCNGTGINPEKTNLIINLTALKADRSEE